jgi:hypothetical protein
MLHGNGRHDRGFLHAHDVSTFSFVPAKKRCKLSDFSSSVCTRPTSRKVKRKQEGIIRSKVSWFLKNPLRQQNHLFLSFGLKVARPPMDL